MAQTLRFLGNLLLALGFLLILVGALGILFTDGLAKLLHIFSPFNIFNWVAVAIVLTPGLALKAWAKNIDKGKS